MVGMTGSSAWRAKSGRLLPGDLGHTPGEYFLEFFPGRRVLLPCQGQGEHGTRGHALRSPETLGRLYPHLRVLVSQPGAAERLKRLRTAHAGKSVRRVTSGSRILLGRQQLQ